MDKTQKRVISFDMIELGESVAKFAEEIQMKVREKTSSIRLSEKNDPCSKEVAQPLSEWPPLFLEMRNILFQIRNSISLISDDIDRSEI